MAAHLPLSGLSVLDFTTLLPGPLTTLMLAEAGADVIKIERPDGGDPVRRVGPFTVDGVSTRFLVLNRGKRSLTLDLKQDRDRRRAHELAAHADVVVEQFRPGVMARLGLGYEPVAEANPGVIYCSITGYGQTGPRATEPGHDLNYAARTGMLSLVHGSDGAPVLPAATVADIGGGSYPAVVNILLALAQRERTGRGVHLDIAMAENLFTFIYAAVAGGLGDAWPQPDGELLTGGSPRYDIYATADGGHLAVAALEQPFWETFTETIGLPPALRDDRPDPPATRDAVAQRIAGATTAAWEQAFDGLDACVTVVRDLPGALGDPHLAARGLFDGRVGPAGSPHAVPVMHLPTQGLPGLN
jgi:alpha-methylacyl-CoA racemase